LKALEYGSFFARQAIRGDNLMKSGNLFQREIFDIDVDEIR
jgi:hypothetical protein